MMKLRQVNETFAKNFGDYYFDLFPYTTITVEKIYPLKPQVDGALDEKEKKWKWVLYDKPKPDWESKEATYFVVALKDELNPKEMYGFGVLTVEVYS